MNKNCDTRNVDENQQMLAIRGPKGRFHSVRDARKHAARIGLLVLVYVAIGVLLDISKFAAPDYTGFLLIALPFLGVLASSIYFIRDLPKRADKDGKTDFLTLSFVYCILALVVVISICGPNIGPAWSSAVIPGAFCFVFFAAKFLTTIILYSCKNVSFWLFRYSEDRPYKTIKSGQTKDGASN